MKKVLIRYTNISHCDQEYQQRIQDIGGFYQQLPFGHDYQIIDSNNLDQTFIELPADTSWVVVLAVGHCTQDRGLYDELIEIAVTAGSPLVGHILNFPDQYPHLHPQLFAVDYQVWLRVGKPTWEYDSRPQAFSSYTIIASNETYHDNYTPYWIMPGKELNEYSVSEMQVGAEVIRRLLEHQHTIINVPESIRQKKFHLYPDQDWQMFNAFFQGQPYLGANSSQKQYTELLEHLAKQVRRQYYALNTEPLARIPASIPISHYAGVASGLKLVATMIKNGYDENTKITHFDFSSAALEFQQYIRDNWNGNLTNYQLVCDQFLQSTTNLYPCAPLGSWDSNIQHLLEYIEISQEEFQQHWQHYLTLDVTFMNCNLYEADGQIKLAERCKLFASSYVWVSNAFYMEYSLVKLGKKYLETKRNEFVDNLSKSSALILLDTEDPWRQGIITINH